MRNETLLLTLNMFSATGGIEKVSRIAGKALYQMEQEGAISKLKVFSMYDKREQVDIRYFPAKIFDGFGTRKFRFVLRVVQQGIDSKLVILSHINLLTAGYLIKLISPKTRLVLLAHGIEVWSPLPSWKRHMLGKCDKILPVSQFTKERMMEQYGIDEANFTVLNNCLDPYLAERVPREKDPVLLKRYRIESNDIVLLTLSRLSSKERYKGYDNVLYAIKNLKEIYPTIKYLVVGKYDVKEKKRLDNIIKILQLENNIIFTGFIPDEELALHYDLADLYIMPSKKEGFGIVFIEAMYYGKPVIAGNKDGSVDALCNGKFGLLVDPDSKEEITEAIKKVISNKAAYIPSQQAVLEKFGYPVYKENMKRIISELLVVNG